MSFSTWHFLELVGGFLQILWFPPLLHWLIVLANPIKLKINRILTQWKFNGRTGRSHHMACDMFHVINDQCVAHDFHIITPWSRRHACQRQFATHWGDCKKAQNANCSVIIIFLLFLLSLI